MPLELHANDNAREGKPAIWLFQGKSVALLIAGVVMGISLFRILDTLSIDWWVALPLSLVPLALLGAFVHCLVNGKPPSFAADLFVWFAWRFRARLYLIGLLDRPPRL